MNGIRRGLQITLDYYLWLSEQLKDDPRIAPIRAWIDDLKAIKGAVKMVKGKLTVQNAAAVAVLLGDPFANSRAVFHEVTGK